MVRESQYIEDYLDQAEAHGWTPGTYLGRTLKGKAKSYSGSYYRALQASIDRRERSGEVVRVTSAGGSVAYVRNNPTRGGQ